MLNYQKVIELYNDFFFYVKIILVIKMKERYIETNLKKQELADLLKDYQKRSDQFSIVRYYEEYMSLEEYEQMQLELKTYIIQAHERRLLDYQNNQDGYRDELNQLFHFVNEDEAADYFDDLLNQEMDIYDNCQYCEFEHQTQKSLSFPKDYFIERKLTRITPVTIGPVFEMLTFSIEALDIVTSKMKKLFSTYQVFGDEFEDLCFYKDGEVIFKICSHEEFAIAYEDM